MQLCWANIACITEGEFVLICLGFNEDINWVEFEEGKKLAKEQYVTITAFIEFYLQSDSFINCYFMGHLISYWNIDFFYSRNKILMLLIHKSWCGACKNLKPKFATDMALQKESENFVMVNVVVRQHFL